MSTPNKPHDNPESQIVENDIKAKLKQFREKAPGKEEILYDFVDFLSVYPYLNDECVPGGFLVAMALAMHDLAEGKSNGEEITHPIMNYPHEQVSTLINETPTIAEVCFSEEFAEDVKTSFENVKKLMLEKQTNQRLLAETLEGGGELLQLLWGTGFERINDETEDTTESITFSEQEYFDTAHEIAKYIIDFIENNENIHTSWNNNLSESPNPFYNQTKSGFFLEYSYSTPSNLWTPWGKWKLTSNWVATSGKVDLSKMLEGLWATLFIEEGSNKMGSYGPVYKLTQFNGQPLPKPTEKTKEEYTPYKDIKESWKSFDALYLERQIAEAAKNAPKEAPIDTFKLISLLDAYENDSLSEDEIKERDELLTAITVKNRLSYVMGSWRDKEFVHILQYPTNVRHKSGNSNDLWNVEYNKDETKLTDTVNVDNEEIQLIARYIGICLQKYGSAYAGAGKDNDSKLYVLYEADDLIKF